MQYVMKQKFFSLGHSFSVLNTDGGEVFSIDGRAFSFGDKLSVQDTARNEVARITQRLLSWTKAYEIYRGDRLCGSVKKEMFPLLKSRFTVDLPGGDSLLVEGDLLDNEYTFRQRGAQVAQVSKKRFSWLGTYGIDVAEGQDDVLVVCSVAIIDLTCHQP